MKTCLSCGWEGASGKPINKRAEVDKPKSWPDWKMRRMTKQHTHFPPFGEQEGERRTQERGLKIENLSAGDRAKWGSNASFELWCWYFTKWNLWHSYMNAITFDISSGYFTRLTPNISSFSLKKGSCWEECHLLNHQHSNLCFVFWYFLCCWNTCLYQR